jgi:hypothetical protein
MNSRLYPAGAVDVEKPWALFRSQWAAGLGKHGNKEGLKLNILFNKKGGWKYMLKESMEELLGEIEKVERRQNWVPGKERWGLKIKVTVIEKLLWKSDYDDWVFEDCTEARIMCSADTWDLSRAPLYGYQLRLRGRYP